MRVSASEFKDLADGLYIQLTINRRFADILSKCTSFIINPTIIDYRTGNLARGNFVSGKCFETRRRMVIEKKGRRFAGFMRTSIGRIEMRSSLVSRDGASAGGAAVKRVRVVMH